MRSKIIKEKITQLVKTAGILTTNNGLGRVLEDPMRIFIVLGLVSGTVMIFLMPLFMVPDETVHFYRAYQVGEGRVISNNIDGKIGGHVPVVPQSVEENKGQPSHFQAFSSLPPATESFAMFPSTALYSPVGYLPQAIGIDIGRIAHSSVNAMVLMGRLVNLLVYVALVALAIKLARTGKWVYAVIGLFPVAIQEAASLSPDVMNVGLAFVAIALIQRLFMQTEAIHKWQWVSLVFISVGLGLTKQVNFLLLVPIIFLPTSVFRSMKHRLGVVLSTVGVAALLAGVWYALIKFSYHDLNYATQIGLQGVNQEGQLGHILANPLHFIATLFRTYIFEGFKGIPMPDFFWASMHGHFSWFTYKLPLTFILAGYAVLLLVFLHKESLPHDKKKDKRITVLVATQTATFILSLLAIAGVLYLAWTAVGSPQVAGIQGRYFIPLVPLLIPLFGFFTRFVTVSFRSPKTKGVIVASVSGLNLLAMMLLTYRWFY